MILASKSPRRKEILEGFGFFLRVITPDIEEVSSKDQIKDQIEDISRKKVLEIAKDFHNEYVVAADTVVVIDDRVLGKPKDEMEAAQILNLLSGRTHKVITAYSLYNKDKKIDITNSLEVEVKFRELTAEQIEWYIASGEPMDKAGAYGIQQKGAMLVEKIAGDFFTVMGFPIGDFMAEIQKLGIKLENIGDM